jgi:hypothetical protein
MLNASDLRRFKRRHTDHFDRGNRLPAQIQWVDKEITPKSHIFLRVHDTFYVADTNQDIQDKDWIMRIYISEVKGNVQAEIYRSTAHYDKSGDLSDLLLFKIIHTDCPRIGLKKMALNPKWKRIQIKSKNKSK